MRKFRSLKKTQTSPKALQVFESLLNEADQMSAQFKTQLEEKNRLIKRINDQLDKKIMSLNLLLNRADALLSLNGDIGGNNDGQKPAKAQEGNILKLANKGYDLEKIARSLSIPKGEVKLVLDLKKKISQLSGKDQAS
jgi:hypothetical protein